MVDGWHKLLLLENNEWPAASSLDKWNNTLLLKWTTGNGVLKKNLFYLQKRDASNISLKSSCSQRQHYPERLKLRLKVLWRKWLFRKSQLQVQLFTSALLKYLLYFMNNCNYCCEIVKLTESNCSKSHPCKWKYLQLLF